jgi:hypothetical protein
MRIEPATSLSPSMDFHVVKKIGGCRDYRFIVLGLGARVEVQ